MRIIVAGGRDFGYRFTTEGFQNDDWFQRCRRQMFGALDQLCADHGDEYLMPRKNIRIVSGMARGADSMAIEWAVVNFVPVDEYPADWNGRGKRAGYERNERMAQNADALVAFWDGESKGTKHMIDLAFKYGLEVHVYRYSNAEERF